MACDTPIDTLIMDAALVALETGLTGDLAVFRGFWASAD
jgi:hypothetical protein